MQTNRKEKARAGLLSLLVVLIISTGLFLLAPHLKFGPDNWAPFAPVSLRLAGVIVVLVIWALWILWSQQRLGPAAAEEEPSAPPDSVRNFHRDPASIAARQNRTRITEILRDKSRRGLGKFSPYERPWYLVLGREGAGKEALLTRTGLEMSRVGYAESDQGLSSTGSRWWITDEALFIDTAGLLGNPEQTSQDREYFWNVLLDTLRSYRRRRPVNGVMVTIDFGELVGSPEDERAAFAQTLRRSLRELAARLKVEIPVYLVCTKMDTVPGFVDFFADAGLEEREQVWGVSMGRLEAGEVMTLEFLNEKLRELSASLYARMLARLNRETDSNLRCDILAFPKHFAGARSAVAIFARDVFKSSGSVVEPCLRGIYFTAAEPVVVEQAVKLFPSVFREQQVVDQTSKSFFVRRLFQDLILAEPDLSGFDTRYERVLIWSRRAAVGVAAMVCITAGIAWAAVTSRHEQVMQSFREQLAQYEEARAADASGQSLTELAPALNTLWRAVKVAQESGMQSWASAGLADNRLAESAQTLYLNELHRLLLPQLLGMLEQELEQSREDEEVYETLRTYLMFGHLEHLDKVRVLEWLTRAWHGQRTNPQVQAALAGHVERLLGASLQPSVLDGQLVANARARITAIPLAQRIYEHIRRKPEHRREIALMEHLGVSPHSVFKVDPQKRPHLQIPFLFTREGQKAFAAGLNAPQVSAFAGEAWVLGDAGSHASAMHTADMQTIRREVTALYADEYVKVWERAVDAVDLVDIRSLQQLDMLLRNLQDARQSALRNLLAMVAMNTGQEALLPGAAKALGTRLQPDGNAENPGSQVESAMAAGGQKVVDTIGSVFVGAAELATVANRFRELNRVAATEMSAEMPTGGLGDHLQALHAWVAEISSAADPGARAFSMAAARYGDVSANPAMALHDYAQTFPPPVRDWLERLADESWRLVTDSARQHLAATWTSQVYEPYRRTLQGRYPLNGAAAEEAALHDFVQFFKSGGTLDQYYQDFLSPFIVSTGQWRNRTVDRQSLRIPANILRQLQRAGKIRDAFFRNDDGSVNMTLNLRPHAMDESDARFSMEVGDQRLSYSHGPRFWTSLTWEATSENLLIRLAFEDLQGRWHHRDYHGVWAWLRLLDASYMERTADQAAYLVTFAMEDQAQFARSRQKIVYEIKTQGADNPLRRDLLTTFDLPAGF